MFKNSLYDIHISTDLLKLHCFTLTLNYFIKIRAPAYVYCQTRNHHQNDEHLDSEYMKEYHNLLYSLGLITNGPFFI
jgi:hypothetical protein